MTECEAVRVALESVHDRPRPIGACYQVVTPRDAQQYVTRLFLQTRDGEMVVKNKTGKRDKRRDYNVRERLCDYFPRFIFLGQRRS